MYHQQKRPCLGADAPSGKRPLSPVSVFLPRNQPSPKSSSRSMSSMRSPRRRLSSSGLRARNSSARLVSGGLAVHGKQPLGHVRTTTSWSPARQCSVWLRCMLATVGVVVAQWLRGSEARRLRGPAAAAAAAVERTGGSDGGGHPGIHRALLAHLMLCCWAWGWECARSVGGHERRSLTRATGSRGAPGAAQLQREVAGARSGAAVVVVVVARYY
jgi:hypothetical protein